MDTTAAKRAFSSFSLSAETLRSVEAKGYETPTPVQEETIPLALAGKDLVVQSRTGTGKTAAFGIPIVEKVDAAHGAVQAVVLAPPPWGGAGLLGRPLPRARRGGPDARHGLRRRDGPDHGVRPRHAPDDALLGHGADRDPRPHLPLHGRAGVGASLRGPDLRQR